MRGSIKRRRAIETSSFFIQQERAQAKRQDCESKENEKGIDKPVCLPQRAEQAPLTRRIIALFEAQ